MKDLSIVHTESIDGTHHVVVVSSHLRDVVSTSTLPSRTNAVPYAQERQTHVDMLYKQL